MECNDAIMECNHHKSKCQLVGKDNNALTKYKKLYEQEQAEILIKWILIVTQ